MSIQDFIRRILPADDRFFTGLEEHVNVCAGTAEVMAAFGATLADPERFLADISAKDAQSKTLRNEIRLMLEAVFVTPVDREDIYRLVVTLDHVIDNQRVAAGGIVDCGKKELRSAVRSLLGLTVEATHVLKEAMPSLRRHQLTSQEPLRKRLTELKRRCVSVHENELAALSRDPLVEVKEMLHQREILNALAGVLHACAAAGDILENVAIKNG